MKNRSFYSWLCYSLILLLCAVFAWSFSIFYWPSKIFIINDFSDIPNYTLISTPENPHTHQAAGHYYLNSIEYINQHHFFNRYRYNPTTRQIPPQSEVDGVNIVDPRGILLNMKNGLVLYNPSYQQYLVIAPDNLEKRDKTYPLLRNGPDIQALKTYFKQFDQRVAQQNAQTIDEEQRQFYLNNKLYFSLNLKSWHYFHHHDFMFGVISADYLGKASSENNFLYGWLNNLWIEKLLTLSGDFNFQHYLEIVYSFYPIYYFLWIGLVYFLCRNSALTLLAALLAFANAYLMGCEAIRFQPGLSPIRHLLDLPTILCYCLFLHQQKLVRWVYLSAAIILSFLSILYNVEFGISISAALIGSLLIYTFVQSSDKRPYLYGLIGSLALTLIALYCLPKSPYSLIKYFFLGAATPAANYTLPYIIGGISLGIYLFLGLDQKNSVTSKIQILFLCFYYQAYALYFIIYTEPSHIRNTSPLAILLAVCVLLNLRHHIKRPVEVTNFYVALFIPSLIFYGISQFAYTKGFEWPYLQYQKVHRIYHWDFKRAQFNTDMDPKPFSNALALLQKYSDTPEIVLISKYDDILLWLSDHYNTIPYRSLGIDLPTETEESIAIKAIEHNASCYLFVDADIDSSHFGDISFMPRSIPEPYGSTENIRNNDIFAVKTYYAIAHVFHQIEHQYHLIVHGDLIDVYQAKHCDRNHAQ